MDEEEYRAYGYPFPSDGIRVSQLEEALRIIRSLCVEEKAPFAGKYYQIRDAYCEPKPDPIPPIMVGGEKPRMLRLAAKYADCWNVSSLGIESYRQVAEECERACFEVGRDPATLRRSWVGGCACAPTQQDALAMAGDRYSATNTIDDFGLVGTPQQVIEQMLPFIEKGVDYFILDCGGFPRLTTLEMLATRVLPALNN